MHRIHRLEIDTESFEALKIESDRVWPLEACALLIGRVYGDVAVVYKVSIVENADASQITFSIRPEDLLRAYLDAEREGLDVIGVFHSHPAPPQPSVRDLEFMKINPIVWLIISKPSGDYGAFQWIEGSIERVEVNLVNKKKVGRVDRNR
ncbi:MAG: M67 family metallopeptidase [Nitrososphaerota archaeon]|nr:M67 family metallopeptidase [Nitrososphaerales archaeon]MDW8044438.1 M67 family metallopeptidase [Nitrososphaerota archaeon]